MKGRGPGRRRLLGPGIKVSEIVPGRDLNSTSSGTTKGVRE